MKKCRHCYKAYRDCPYYEEDHCTFKDKNHYNLDTLLKLDQVEVKICKK